MAKKAKAGSSIVSEYDITKYIDLDDEPELDEEYQTIPHSEDEILTPGLSLDLEDTVENYIKAGKIGWAEKRNLRRLATENGELEAGVSEADSAILERAVEYHRIVSAMLREKDDLEKLALDDDPYDAERDVEPSDAEKLATEESSRLFKEIQDLELHRGELNGKRITVLEELQAASNTENSAMAALHVVIEEKLDGISQLHDITRSHFSSEEETAFEQNVGELNSYMNGEFDPLAADDEDYGPLPKDAGEPIDAHREVVDYKPSFSDLFGSTADDDQEPAGDDLSEPQDDFDESRASEDMVAEGAFWHTEPEDEAAIEVELEESAEFYANEEEPAAEETAAEETAVIFEQLKAKYGISF